MINYCNTEGCIIYREHNDNLPRRGDIIIIDIDGEEDINFEVIGIERYFETTGEPKKSPLGHTTQDIKDEHNYCVILAPHEYNEEVGF